MDRSPQHFAHYLVARVVPARGAERLPERVRKRQIPARVAQPPSLRRVAVRR